MTNKLQQIIAELESFKCEVSRPLDVFQNIMVKRAVAVVTKHLAVTDDDVERAAEAIDKIGSEIYDLAKPKARAALKAYLGET